MLICLFLLKAIIPITNPNRIMSIVICAIYALFGILIYGLLILKLKVIPNVSRVKDIKNAYKEMRK